MASGGNVNLTRRTRRWRPRVGQPVTSNTQNFSISRNSHTYPSKELRPARQIRVSIPAERVWRGIIGDQVTKHTTKGCR